MKEKHTRLKILLRATQLICGHKLRPSESRAFACSPQSHCRSSLSLNFHFTSLPFSHPFPRNFYKSSLVNMHIGVQMRVSYMCPLPLFLTMNLTLTLGISDLSTTWTLLHSLGQVLPLFFFFIVSYLTWEPSCKLKTLTVSSRKITRSICKSNSPSGSLYHTCFLPNDLLVGLSPKTLTTDAITESSQGHRSSSDPTLHQCSPHKNSSCCSTSIRENIYSTFLPSSGHRALRCIFRKS